MKGKQGFLTYLILLSVIGFLLALTACGSKQVETTSEQAEKAMEEYESITIKLAHIFPETQVEGKAALKVKEYIETATNGAVTVEIFPAGQLGNQQTLIELREQGAINIDVHGLANQPEYDAFFLPYVFNDDVHIRKVMTSDFAQKWADNYIKNTGGRILGIYSRGYRHLMLRNEASKMADLKGLKIRVPETPALVAMCEAWGAAPTPIGWPETYNALLLKTVDGAENTLSLLYNQKFYEVAKYILLTKHSISPVYWIINNSFFESCSESLQKVIIDAVDQAMKYAVEENAKEEMLFIEKFEEMGVKIIEPENMDEFREAVRSKIGNLAQKYWTEGEYEKILQLAD